jgi:hypothetical protein
LTELGRDKDAHAWRKRAEIAEAALEETYGSVHELDDQEVLTEWNEPEETEKADTAEAVIEVVEPVETTEVADFDKLNQPGVVEPVETTEEAG